MVLVFPALMGERREFFSDSAAFVVFLVFSVETKEEEELSEEEEEELSDENNSPWDISLDEEDSVKVSMMSESSLDQE